MPSNHDYLRHLAGRALGLDDLILLKSGNLWVLVYVTDMPPDATTIQLYVKEIGPSCTTLPLTSRRFRRVDTVEDANAALRLVLAPTNIRGLECGGLFYDETVIAAAVNSVKENVLAMIRTFGCLYVPETTAPPVEYRKVLSVLSSQSTLFRKRFLLSGANGKQWAMKRFVRWMQVNMSNVEPVFLDDTVRRPFYRLKGVLPSSPLSPQSVQSPREDDVLEAPTVHDSERPLPPPSWCNCLSQGDKIEVAVKVEEGRQEDAEAHFWAPAVVLYVHETEGWIHVRIDEGSDVWDDYLFWNEEKGAADEGEEEWRRVKRNFTSLGGSTSTSRKRVRIGYTGIESGGSQKNDEADDVEDEPGEYEDEHCAEKEADAVVEETEVEAEAEAQSETCTAPIQHLEKELNSGQLLFAIEECFFARSGRPQSGRIFERCETLEKVLGISNKHVNINARIGAIRDAAVLNGFLA